MTFDKEINIALVQNLKLKAKVLAIVFGVILLMQIISLTYFYTQTNIFEEIVSIKMAMLGPLLLLFAFSFEIYAHHYFNKLLLIEKEIAKNFAYAITFIEISFPTCIIIFASVFFSDNNFVTLLQLLNSPPTYMYFLMIMLSTLMLDFRLCVFAGFIAGLQFVTLTLCFMFTEGIHNIIDLPNNIFKGILMLICGIIAGLVSKKIKEAVLSSVKSKNDLINRLDVLVKEKTFEIEFQKEEIMQKNKDITDSIHYASKIQNSLMPTEKYIDKSIKRLSDK